MNTKTLKSYLRLFRWREYYGNVTVITLLGAFVAKPDSLVTIGLVCVANLLNSAFAFMFNDIEDVEDDKLDKKKKLRNPISAGVLKMSHAQVLTTAVFMVSSVIYYSLGMDVFLVGMSGLLMGYLYSFRGVRLKSKPVVDIASHGYFLGSVYYIAAVLVGSHRFSMPVIVGVGLAIFITSLVGDIKNELRDYEADRKAKIVNTASVLKLMWMKNYLVYIFGVLNFTLVVFVMVHTSLVVRLIMVGSGVAAAVYYYNKINNLEKYAQYPYQQEVYFAVGLLLYLAA